MRFHNTNSIEAVGFNFSACAEFDHTAQILLSHSKYSKSALCFQLLLLSALFLPILIFKLGMKLPIKHKHAFVNIYPDTSTLLCSYLENEMRLYDFYYNVKRFEYYYYYVYNLIKIHV